MVESRDYIDLETGKRKSLPDELEMLTSEARERRRIDNEPYEPGDIREEGRRFMPWYVSKIITDGLRETGSDLENEIGIRKDRLGVYKIQREAAFGRGISDKVKMIYLRIAADDNVTCAIIFRKPKGAFSENDLLKLAMEAYMEASKLKKSLNNSRRSGLKLEYLANNLIRYVPIIQDVFSMLKVSGKVGGLENIFDISCAENASKEIDALTRSLDMSIESKKSLYCSMRVKYDEELDLSKRGEIRKNLRELYLMIKAEDPAFKDEKLFGKVNMLGIESLKEQAVAEAELDEKGMLLERELDSDKDPEKL